MSTLSIAIRMAHAQDRIESNERSRETFRKACENFPGLFIGETHDRRHAVQRRRLAMLDYALDLVVGKRLAQRAAINTFRSSIVEARTPRMTEADWDKAFARPVPAGMTEEEHLEQLLTHDAPEPYMRGLTPTMDEDRTADVVNAREDEHLNK
jgi:hypothetical protein